MNEVLYTKTFNEWQQELDTELKELYCAKEDKPYPFYKPADKYNRDGSRKGIR